MSTTTNTSSFQKTYSSDGIKNATVQIQREGENHSLSCSTAVASTTGSVGGCFIATAVYGTPLDSHVVSLREFRDEKLMKSELGADFVQTYYKYSPPIAEYISTRENLKSIVRVGLLPLIFIAENI